nr:ribonuclease HII (rnhB) [uncultured marine thaumarchaeote AD1000_71_A04]
MNKSLVSGIDEAGRGSIIGPLVIASVTANKKTIKKFSRIGVKDSKKLSAKNREIFARIIMDESENVMISKLTEKK